MAISRNLADALHRIVDHLAVREEQTSVDLHSAVEAEVETPQSDETVAADAEADTGE